MLNVYARKYCPILKSPSRRYRYFLLQCSLYNLNKSIPQNNNPQNDKSFDISYNLVTCYKSSTVTFLPASPALQTCLPCSVFLYFLTCIVCHGYCSLGKISRPVPKKTTNEAIFYVILCSRQRVGVLTR